MEGERVLKCHLVDLGGDKVDPHLEVGIVTEIGTPPKEGAEVDIGLGVSSAEHLIISCTFNTYRYYYIITTTIYSTTGQLPSLHTPT